VSALTSRKALRTPMPASIRPQLSTSIAQPPTDSGWVHEIKHDGHRIIAYVDQGKSG